jgi:osmotically-inducible protein OsmY|tara:strand:- start:6720 stop:7112 length:393 start_codon:yes stop_codon:yes gene_type:complete
MSEGYKTSNSRSYYKNDSGWDQDAAGYERGGHFRKGPKNDNRSTERNRERVCDVLHDDHHLDASEIEVSTDENGEVTLSGTVASRDDKRRAEDCAYKVRGVRHVQNDIQITAAESTSEAVQTETSSRKTT